MDKIYSPSTRLPVPIDILHRFCMWKDWLLKIILQLVSLVSWLTDSKLTLKLGTWSMISFDISKLPHVSTIVVRSSVKPIGMGFTNLFLLCSTHWGMIMWSVASVSTIHYVGSKALKDKCWFAKLHESSECWFERECVQAICECAPLDPDGLVIPWFPSSNVRDAYPPSGSAWFPHMLKWFINVENYCPVKVRLWSGKLCRTTSSVPFTSSVAAW